MKCTSPKEIATVDFKKLAIRPGEDELTIETVPGFRFLVNLQTRTVTLLPAPAPVKKSRKIRAPDPTDPPMPPPWPRGRKGR